MKRIIFGIICLGIGVIVLMAYTRDVQLNLESNSFKDGDFLPIEHAYRECGGKNISPELHWSHAPENTQSFALICRDPDAPSGDFKHWGIFNIPGNQHALPPHMPRQREINGMLQIGNDYGSGTIGYDGPCPPSGTHHYIFTLYALDTALSSGIKTIDDLERAMDGHTLSTATLTGRFKSRS